MTQPWYIIPKTNFTDKRAIIIGGGLAGTSAAYSLAIRGWEVLIIERAGELASGASGNPFGIMTPLVTHKNDPIGEFYLSGFEYSLRHLQKLVECGMPVQFYNSGVLELSTGKIDKNINECIPNQYIERLITVEATDISGVEIKTAALYLPKCGFVSPADLCRSNILAGRGNIKTIFSREVTELSFINNIWSVHSAGEVIATAPVVIIANSTCVTKINQCNFIPINAVRGQLTYLPAMGLRLKTILCYDGGYITPEINGMHYVGATYSRDNLNTEVNAADHIENIINLKRVFDIDVHMEKLQGRVSFRASSIDRRPVVGALPDVEAFYKDYADLRHGRKKQYPQGKYLPGLYVAAGFGSRGLTSCGIAGELLAAMINNEKLPLADNIVDGLNPARFVIKKIKLGQES